MPSLSGPGAKVLLVEDNSADVCLLRGILDEHPSGLTIEVASSLGAALQRLSGSGIDLVLTDLRLPDSLEGQTVPLLREKAPEIPIVVLSGLEDEDVALRMIEHGAQDYLVKGRIDHRSLVRTLRYAFERHSWQEELRKAHDDLEVRVEERTSELADTAARLEDALFQLQQAQQRMVQQERLRALGQMASGIAHDFNNALAPILGYSDLLLQGRRLAPEKV
ncbi:MAG TPA: response regulator, partial [Chthoniobacteraceae bacterium]